MRWSALVPDKQGSVRKSRLSIALDEAARFRLAERMFDHVLAVVRALPEIEKVWVLSPATPVSKTVRWIKDQGRGLNREIELCRGQLGGALVIVHGDLPLLQADDIRALIAATAEATIAIAPDRHGAGTNALALAPGAELAFAFGRGSSAAHLRAAHGRAAIVSRPGLALDVDTPEDLAAARAAGLDL